MNDQPNPAGKVTLEPLDPIEPTASVRDLTTAAALRLCQAFGMPFKADPEHGGVADWNGETLIVGDGRNLSEGEFEEPAEWVLHELAHWLIAAPENRALPNFGLPTVEQIDAGEGTEAMRQKASHAEARAIAYGNLFLRAMRELAGVGL